MNTNIPKLNKTIRMLLEAYVTLGSVKDVPIPEVPIYEVIDGLLLIYTRTFLKLETAQKALKDVRDLAEQTSWGQYDTHLSEYRVMEIIDAATGGEGQEHDGSQRG